jgi:hypothetical protein
MKSNVLFVGAFAVILTALGISQGFQHLRLLSRVKTLLFSRRELSVDAPKIKLRISRAE